MYVCTYTHTYVRTCNMQIGFFRGKLLVFYNKKYYVIEHFFIKIKHILCKPLLYKIINLERIGLLGKKVYEFGLERTKTLRSM